MKFGRKCYWKPLIILTGLLISYLHTCPVGAATIREYPIPTGQSLPVAITRGPDGALWFPEGYANQIGRIDPSTHVITEYAIPTPNSGVFTSITSGPDGALWFTEGGNGDIPNGANQIGRIDPTTHVITEYPIPTPNSGSAYIASGSDGALWFTEQFANQIGRIDPKTHVITEYATLSYPDDTVVPWGITNGPDGALWYIDVGLNGICRIDPTTHATTEYFIPANGAGCGITSGPDGALWFPWHDDQHTAYYIGRIDPTTHAINSYAIPTLSCHAENIICGPDGALWFTEFNANKLGRIDPKTHAITEYAVPTSGSGPIGITKGSNGTLWFTEAFGNKIGQVVLTSGASSGMSSMSLLLLN